MHRRTLCTLLAAATAGFVVALSSCSRQQSTNSAAGQKTLTMATDANYPPYGFYKIAGSQGDPIGFDIDIAKYITGKLGYDLKVSPMDFNGVIPALQAKRVDFGMAGMTPTAERQKSVDFSKLYYEAKNTIVFKKGANIKQVEDLAGKKVGIQLGTTQEQTATKIAQNLSGMSIKTLNDLGAVVQEIKAGRLDVLIVEETAAKGYVSTNPELNYISINLDPQGNAIAFPKGSPLVAEFNRVLQEMKDNGEIKKLEKKWFDDYYKEQAGHKS